MSTTAYGQTRTPQIHLGTSLDTMQWENGPMWRKATMTMRRVCHGHTMRRLNRHKINTATRGAQLSTIQNGLKLEPGSWLVLKFKPFSIGEAFNKTSVNIKCVSIVEKDLTLSATLMNLPPWQFVVCLIPLCHEFIHDGIAVNT